MADDGFNEVQLSAKQLVFLFMAAVVVAAVIFLMGVVFGRGVRDRITTQAAADAATQVPAPGGDALPPTKTTASDADFQKLLMGDAKKPVEPPAAPPEIPGKTPPAKGAQPSKTTTPPTAAPSGPAANAQTSKLVAPPASVPANGRAMPGAGTPDKNAVPPKPTPTSPKPVATPPAALSSGWLIQLGLFNTRANADAMVTSLKAKGFTSFVTATAPYHVQLGPYADKAEATRVKARLDAAGFTDSFLTHK